MKFLYNQTYLILLIIIITIFILFFFNLAVLRYYSFFSYEWQDEAANNQIAWNCSKGNFFYQTIWGGGIFNGHVNPIFLVIAVAYLFFPHFLTWNFLSITGASLSSILIFKISNHLFDNQKLSFFIAFLYLLYPPLHYVLLGRIHTMIFFIPLILMSMYFFIKDNFKCFIISLIFAMMCMESISLYSIVLGCAALVLKKRKKWFFVPFLMGAFWFYLTTWIILPHVSNANLDMGIGANNFYSLDKNTFSQLIRFLISDPVYSLKFMFSEDHVLLICRLLMPLHFMPLFSFITFLGLPGFLQILLFNGPIRNEISHYIIGIIPFIFLGYIWFLKYFSMILSKNKINHKLVQFFQFFIVFLSISVSIYTITGNNIYGKINTDSVIHDKRFFNIQNIFNPEFYTLDEEDLSAWELIKLIPRDAAVAASGDLLIPLSTRQFLMEFGNKEANYNYFKADFIMVNKKNMYHGGGHYSEIGSEDFELLKNMVENGDLRVVLENKNFILLKRNKF